MASKIDRISRIAGYCSPRRHILGCRRQQATSRWGIAFAFARKRPRGRHSLERPLESDRAAANRPPDCQKAMSRLQFA